MKEQIICVATFHRENNYQLALHKKLRLGTSSQPVPCGSQARVKEEGWAWGQQPHPVKTVTATETSTRVSSGTGRQPTETAYDTP